MKHQENTVQALQSELAEIRKRCAELERLYNECKDEEKTLREAEARYRVLLDNSLTGICVQQDAQLVYVNQRFAQLTGYSCEQLIGMPIWDIVAPENRELVIQRYHDRIAGKRPIRQYEINVVKRSGEKRHWAVWFNVIDHDSRPAILGTVVDTTEMVRTRKALQESEQRFRALFETATDCIFIKDADLKYTHVNPAMASLFGISQNELVGTTDVDLFGKRIGRHLERMDRRVLAGERLEIEHVRPVRGVALTFHDVRIPMEDESGAIVGVYGISRDVTDMKKGAFCLAGTAQTECASPVMRSVLSLARTAARREGFVLLLGESGSGKDYLARYIHDHSSRSDGPFFTMNCAALSHEIAESELFGHEAGAFTGAVGRKRGLLELAEGGTLLLNEIGDLPLSIQGKLLTFLDSRSFTRVGGETLVPVNARLIAATNRDLEAATREGRFREDLYYRINVLSIRVPPLRERKEDIPGLVHNILAQLVTEMHVSPPPGIAAESMQALVSYRWPGNVRELRNVLERALMLWEHGPLRVTVGAADQASRALLEVQFPLDRTLHDVENDVVKRLCAEALERAGGSKQGAARLLGISRNSLYRYMKRLGISGGSGTVS